MPVRAPGGSGDALGMRCASRQENKPTPRALVCVWRNRTTPSAARRRRRRKSQVDGVLADAGQIASDGLIAYDVAHILARSQVARHGLLDAALAGIGHVHPNQSASGARFIAGSSRSILPKLARRCVGSCSFVRPAGNERLIAATREYPALYSFHLLTSHRGRRSRTWPRAQRASRRRAPPAPRGQPP